MIPAKLAHTFTFLGTTHNVYHANIGEGLPRHEHGYAHVTAVHSGEVVVRKAGREVTLTRVDAPVLLAADEWHEIEAVKDGTVFENIFAFGSA